MTSRPDDSAGLDLFDETASAVGNFPHAMRGYDRAAVDAYLREVERALSSTKRKLRLAEQAARAKAVETDYQRLGAHTAEVLRAAEAQAAELVRSAELKSARILAAASGDAARLGADARAGAGRVRAESQDAVRSLREDQADQAAAELTVAQEEAQALLRAADEHHHLTLLGAEQAAAALVAAAEAEAQRVRQAALREAAETRAELAGEREEALAQTRTAAEEAAAGVAALLASSRAAHEQYLARLVEDAKTLDQRRDLALREAEQLRAAAAQDASIVAERARAEADRLLLDAQAEGRARAAALREETETLEARKQALVERLAGLAAAAGLSATQFADTAIQPAIEGEPG